MKFKVGDRVRITIAAQKSLRNVWEKRPGGADMIAAWAKTHTVTRVSSGTVTMNYLPEAKIARSSLTAFTLLITEVELAVDVNSTECTCDSRDLFFFGHRNCSARK